MTDNILIFFLLALPGFLSIKIFGLIHPLKEKSLKDILLEAIAFGAFNFGIMSWSILFLTNSNFYEENTLKYYSIFLFSFIIGPIIWPIILDRTLDLLASKNWILQRRSTVWDDFFLRKEPCFIIFHLHNGIKIGGKFADNSVASLYPRSGDIYLEELWEVDEKGHIIKPVTDSLGTIIRSEDYYFMEIFSIPVDNKV